MKEQPHSADFAALYHYSHPAAPTYITEVLCTDLGYRPGLIVDLGCGTGLSCIPWQGIATRIVGIEPDEQMRRWAQKQTKHLPDIQILSGTAEKTDLPEQVADIVTCGQSFGYMEPTAVLSEVNRILKNQGVFAIYDYDWPPICGGEAERAYQKLSDSVNGILSAYPEYSPTSSEMLREEYLRIIEESDCFSKMTDIVFVCREFCDFARLAAIAKSDPRVEFLLTKQPTQLEKLFDEYERALWSIYRETDFFLDFCYHMHISKKQR